ncbi:MAG: DNA replication/repair protein RecF [Oscillospiraceae bacterium]|nr:DNA replication/repair protein RecF [Oscillospiraceae bacterium]
MIIRKVEIEGYKNLSSVNMDFDLGLNILCGENAQGKTNIIEAIWLCSGCRSFRGTKDRGFIGFDKDFAEIKLIFENQLRAQEIKLHFNKAGNNRTVALNGVKLKALSSLFGSFKCVAFTPDDLEIAKGSPEKRRDFIDMSISQIKISYLNALNTYNNVLSQRNSYIKSVAKENSFDICMMDIWDEQLSKAGAYISVLRQIYCNSLNSYTGNLYSEITNFNEKLKIRYKSTIFNELFENKDYQGELAKRYLSKLKKSLKKDLQAGFTTIGIHRDDIIAEINGLPVREYGSQGQARSVALVIKLAAAKLLTEEKNEHPVLLLDDVLSELDPIRQKFVLNNISGMQTIITCCDEKLISNTPNAKRFKIKNGSI